MSSRIGSEQAGRLPQSEQTPWPDDAGLDVREVRRAITQHMDDRPVDSEVAPMMAELLARLENFAAPPRPSTTRRPHPPDGDPPSPQRMLRASGSACSKLRQMVEANPHSDQAQHIARMVETVEELISLKHEVIMRSEQPG
jgi:hypothetical protein